MSDRFWIANARALEASGVARALIDVIHGLPDITPEQRAWLRARLAAVRAERDLAHAELRAAIGGDA